jgi:hypothetical protein
MNDENEDTAKDRFFVGLRVRDNLYGFAIYNTWHYDLVSISGGLELTSKVWRLGFIFIIIAVEFVVYLDINEDLTLED